MDQSVSEYQVLGLWFCSHYTTSLVLFCVVLFCFFQLPLQQATNPSHFHSSIKVGQTILYLRVQSKNAIFKFSRKHVGSPLCAIKYSITSFSRTPFILLHRCRQFPFVLGSSKNFWNRSLQIGAKNMISISESRVLMC